MLKRLWKSRPLDCTVGWSDLPLFANFESGHTYCCRSGILLCVQLQKNGKFPRAYAWQSFNFKKFTGTLNLKICIYLLFTSKKNLKLKLFKHFILGPLIGQIGFWLDKGKIKKILIFSSFLCHEDMKTF